MWQWVKASKAAALIAFFLPWMTVSCSSTEMVRASGWDLAVGRPRLAPQLAQLAGEGAAGTNAHVSLWLLAALAAIVVGLILSFRSARIGAPVVLATSVAAMLVSWVGTARLSDEALRHAAAQRGGGAGLDAVRALQVHVDWRVGFWLCLLALATSAVLSVLSLGRRIR